MTGIDLAEAALAFQTLDPGEVKFIDCFDPGCYAAYVGKCLECEGMYIWCGAGDCQLDCECGRNEEEAQQLSLIEALHERIQDLEDAIREHRESDKEDRDETLYWTMLEPAEGEEE